MRKGLLSVLTLFAGFVCAEHAAAQLSDNPYKFLGNITTRYNVDTDGFTYSDLWNQITPENESKWGSIEGNRDQYNWGSDNSYNYAKQHGFPFKFHCLVWGSQYPNWLTSLPKKEQYEEIVEWMDAVKARYPDLPLIDVVNEAVPGHAPAPYKEALGGDGITGYDWIVKAFELAHERWPDAILIYNDYNTFQWQKTQFIELVQTLIDAGAPVDAYGCQSHDLTDMNVSDFKSAMTEIQNALQIPMYSTEYDIGTENDQLQLQRYKEQIPYMWESNYCAGITLWGFIYGATWTTDGNSGIIRNGKDRPAMTWLREYMASDKARNAGFRKNFPFENGHTKEASVYVTPSTIKASLGDTVSVNVRARMRTKTIDHVDLYINNALKASMNEAPYITSYIPSSTGKVTLKAIVYTTDGSEYTRYSHITTYPPRKPYKGQVLELPGTIQAENFDSGADGMAYHDTDSQDEGGTRYRTDNGGVDIVTGNNGYAIGYTSSGEWLEYTVDIKTPGQYLYTAYVSSGVDNSGFTLGMEKDGSLETFATINVPKTGDNSWDTYKTVEGKCAYEFEAGRNVVRLTITGSSCNIDRIELVPLEKTDRVQLEINADPNPIFSSEKTVISVTPTILPDTVWTGDSYKLEYVKIKSIDIYADGELIAHRTSAPYRVEYSTGKYGRVEIKAMAVDSKKRETDFVFSTLDVLRQRTPYKGAITLPGRLEFENFDKQGEGYSFHDSDDVDEGGHVYRQDNEGVDILSRGNGYCIGNTLAGEWMEYTVELKADESLKFDALVSSGLEGSGFNISLNEDGNLTSLADVQVPQTGNNDWNTYKAVSGVFASKISAGKHILRVTITGSYCNLDMLKIVRDPNAVEQLLEGGTYEVFSPTGVKVGEIQCRDESEIGNGLFTLTGRSGIYLVRNKVTGKTVKRISEE